MFVAETVILFVIVSLILVCTYSDLFCRVQSRDMERLREEEEKEARSAF